MLNVSVYCNRKENAHFHLGSFAIFYVSSNYLYQYALQGYGKHLFFFLDFFFTFFASCKFDLKYLVKSQKKEKKIVTCSNQILVPVSNILTLFNTNTCEQTKNGFFN